MLQYIAAYSGVLRHVAVTTRGAGSGVNATSPVSGNLKIAAGKKKP